MTREPREAVIQDIYDRLRMDREIDRETAQLYFKAVEELKNEGDAQAVVVYDYLTLKATNTRSGYIDPEYKPADLLSWASNIHHNMWGETGLGGKLKARVVLMRMKGKNHED